MPEPTPDGLVLRESGLAGEIGRVRAGLTHWLFGLALPYWSSVGLDRRGPEQRSFGACEHMTLDGRPARPGYKRMRVQARQLYVFSEAARRGVAGAGGIAHGIHAFMSKGARPDGGWARRLDPDGAILDPTADLYDLAFVLFSLAHHAQASGETAPLRQAERTLAFLRRAMARPSGGFANTTPAEPGWRQQNPHMHLFEAALALLEVTGDARWRTLADELFALFRTALLERESGTLGEYFNEEWRRAPGVDGETVEPGHHAEWVWLLDRYETLTGLSTGAAMRILDRVLVTHGTGSETGLVRDEIGRDGALRKGSSRLWSQTEMLRAQCTMFGRAKADGDRAEQVLRLEAIVRTTDNLLVRYLVGAESGVLPPGTWIDQLDPYALPAIDRIPTSSMYHIVCAWVELDRLPA